MRNLYYLFQHPLWLPLDLCLFFRVIRWILNKLGSDTTSLDRKTFSEHGLSKLLESYYHDNSERAIKEALENKLYRKIKIIENNTSICDV